MTQNQYVRQGRAEWEDSESDSDEQLIQDHKEFWGEELIAEKGENITRIYFQNLNGIKWDKDGGNWPAICQAMAGIHADVVGFAEINQNTENYELKQHLETITEKYFDHKKMIMATSNRKVRNTFKPGGTMMLTLMNTVTLVQSTTRDRMGRWVSTRYQGQNQQKLTVIMAYQVCQSQRTGKNTAVNQQINMILEESIRQGIRTRRNPREAFIQDLIGFVQQRKSEGDMILLLGDFNETITDNDSGMTHLLATCNLIDVFGAKLGNTRFPPTYKRGNRRIDYALASPELYPMINRAGYDPFDYRGIFSDHRGMYIDLLTQEMFGNGPADLASRLHREFSANNPDKVTTYIEAKYQELLNHNIEARINRLENLTTPDHTLAESIDRDMTRAAKKASKAARTKYRTPWSPKLAHAWATIHLLKMIKSQMQNAQLNNWAAIQEWRTRHQGMPTSLPSTLPEVNQQLKDAYSKLRAIKQEAEKHRQEYLEEKSQMYAMLEQTDKAKIVRRIKRAEILHKCYRKLQYVQKGNNDTALAEVQVPNDPAISPQQCPNNAESWKTIRAPKEVTRLLLERNRKHFGQAHGTPLTDPDFLAEIKYDGSGLHADLILNGEYEEPDIDRISRLFMRHMMKKTTTELSSALTKEDLIGKLKAWPEKTTTSPSGIHLGHYQALWKRHNCYSPQDPTLSIKFEEKRDMIIRIHLALINYAMKFCYSYDRWQKVINVMLRKDKTNSRIHRLRVIHLYEADYNLVLGVKWREALFHAEDEHLLNDGLYGSRPGRSAHEPVLIETLQNEIYRASMKSGIHKDLDATSCYDRILPWVASMCSRRVGVHHKVALVNCKTLQKARFHLKTSFDVSKEFYTHCDAYPIYGTGQGSGNSPYIWCFVASTLFDAFAEEAHGASFYSYDGQNHIKLYMVGFVDDCSQQVNDFKAYPQPSEDTLIRMMKHDAQLWSDLLWVSGGALEIPKCSFQMIQTEWTSKGRPFLKGQCNAPPLIVSTDEGHWNVKQLSNYQARRSLGIYVSPSGMMTRQFEILRQKSKKFAEDVLVHSLNKREAHMMFHGFYIPSITYPFPVTYLTDGQCHAIETPFLKAILPKCGYNRTMSRAIRFAPTQYGGAGFLSLHIEQGIHLILTAIKHLRCPQQQPGKLGSIALSWAQAHAGVSWPLWQLPARKIPTIPNPWVLSIRQALVKFDARIVGLERSIPPKLRSNDWYIMDVVLDMPQFDTAEIDEINAVRRFYQVTTAADIADDRGIKVREDIWRGTSTPHPDDYTVEFFNQEKPDTHAFRAWKKFLRLVANKDRTLHHPLNEWIQPYGSCRRRPTWVYQHETQNLYFRKRRDQYIQCERTYYSYEYPTELNTHTVTPPLTAYPVTIINLGSRVMIRPTRRQPNPSSQVTRPVEFSNFLHTLDTWEYRLLQATQLGGTPHEAIDMLNDGSVLFMASDGSVIDTHFASFGFTINHVTSKTCIASGYGPVPGDHPSSFRAEAYGVLALARLLFRLSEFTGKPIRQNVCHWIDNKGVVNRLNRELQRKYTTPNSTLSPDWDVVHEAARTFASLPDITYQAKWIRSHQDSQIGYSHLTQAAQMNCDADTLASVFHENIQARHRQPVVPMMPNTGVQLEIQGRTITGHYKRVLRHTITVPALQGYLMKRFTWTESIVDSLDWEVLGKIINGYDDRRPTLVKHLHGIAPTGKYANRNDRHESPLCPACSLHVETNDHVFKCSADSRNIWRRKVINDIEAQEHHKPTDPILRAILAEGIQLCLTNDEAHLSSCPFPSNYHSLIQQQNDIGWLQLFRGRWTKEWKRCYEAWARQCGLSHPARLAITWVHTQGCQLVQAWWNLWQIRNNERHQRDEHRTQTYRRSVILSQMEELYSFRTKVMTVDSNIFPYGTAQAHMNSETSLDALQDWCMDNGPAILASCHQAKKLGITGTGDIRLFMEQTQNGSDSARAEGNDGS